MIIKSALLSVACNLCTQLFVDSIRFKLDLKQVTSCCSRHHGWCQIFHGALAVKTCNIAIKYHMKLDIITMIWTMHSDSQRHVSTTLVTGVIGVTVRINLQHHNLTVFPRLKLCSRQDVVLIRPDENSCLLLSPEMLKQSLAEWELAKASAWIWI